MTVYLVAVHHVTHTCPADPQPHPIITTRQILGVIDGGPCLAPVTIRVGANTATIPCGRHEPMQRQCVACRITIDVQAVGATHIGAAPTGRPSPSPFADFSLRPR